MNRHHHENLDLNRRWTLIIPKEIRVFELLHNVTILLEMHYRNLLDPMLWAGLIQQTLQIHSAAALGQFTFSALHISVSHKI